LTSLLIEKLDVYPIKVPLIRPFRIALETVTDYEGVLVRIRLSNGVEGWGEAAPDLAITGETWMTALSILEHQIKPRVLGHDISVYSDILMEIDRAILGNPSAKAALDIAIHDALAKQARLSLNTMLGRAVHSLETTQTVGLENREETIKQARGLRDEGTSRMKFKIGSKPEDDVDRIRAVRESLGNDFHITVDANQGYSVRQAIEALTHMERFDIDFCEQPVHYKDIDGLAEVRRNSPIPIMADESVHSPRDALRIARQKAADMINIKLMKSGGIHAARKIAAIAEAAGMPCMVGCMVETKVGIAAGCQFATSQSIVKYADLDSHVTLREDPTKGGVELKGSSERLEAGPGLALTIDESLLRKLLVQR
jgi:o-succinylbenzoate synthase